MTRVTPRLSAKVKFRSFTLGALVADQGGCCRHHHDDRGFDEECHGEGNSVSCQVKLGFGKPVHDGSKKRAFSRHHEPGSRQRDPEAENGMRRDSTRWGAGLRTHQEAVARHPAAQTENAPGRRVLATFPVRNHDECLCWGCLHMKLVPEGRFCMSSTTSCHLST